MKLVSFPSVRSCRSRGANREQKSSKGSKREQKKSIFTEQRFTDNEKNGTAESRRIQGQKEENPDSVEVSVVVTPTRIELVWKTAERRRIHRFSKIVAHILAQKSQRKIMKSKIKVRQ